MLMRTTNSDITLHSHSQRLIDHHELDEINELDELDKIESLAVMKITMNIIIIHLMRVVLKYSLLGRFSVLLGPVSSNHYT